VEGIRAIVHDIWEQDIIPHVCEAQIQGDASAVWVAKEHDRVLGFVSAFLTMDRAASRRWEVDLLAVQPTSQGRGLGQGLIQRVCQDAEGCAAVVARAAVRVGNLPSQRVFEKIGFSTDGQVHQLLLWSPQAGQDPVLLPAGASLLPVDTLTYRGLWIEGLTRLRHGEQRSVVATARATIAREDRLNTGAMVPLEETHLLEPDLRSQAKMHGEYRWFIKPIMKT
jgi:GNAT superfamily N-acetyltransferase